MKHFAVVGNPISHSRSPELYNSAFADIGFDGYYSRILAHEVEDVKLLLNSQNLAGINVTAPMKRKMNAICDSFSPEAKAIGAVNYLSNGGNPDGDLVGYNTDCIGVEEVIAKHGLNTRKVLILGAGNAARAAVYALQQTGCEIVVAARPGNSSKKLQEDFKVRLIDIKNYYAELRNVSLLISALPREVFTGEPAKEFDGADLTIFDANYSNSYFQKVAEHCNLPFICGLEWLGAQARPCFRYMTGSDKFNPSLPPVHNRNLAFIGFSGCGKSTIATEIANMSGCHCADLDSMISNQFGMPLTRVFERFGEEEFRKVETNFLRRLMNENRLVIACGAGILDVEENREILSKDAFRVRLYAPLETCLERVALTEPRPKLRNPAEAEQLFKRRNSLYFENSDLNFVTERKTVHECAAFILQDLQYFENNNA